MASAFSLRPDSLAFLERQPILPRVDRDRIALDEMAFEHPQRQRIKYQALNGALERPRAVGGIVALADEQLLRFLGEPDVDLPLFEALHQPGDLDVDDLLQVLAAERMEEDDFVDAIEELGPEVIAQGVHHLAARPFVNFTARGAPPPLGV